MATTGAIPGSFNQIVVFGDSLSDNGNLIALSKRTRLKYGLYRWLYRILCGNPTTAFVGGRHTNGPVAVEVLARELDLSLDPAWAGPDGTNFAVSGAYVSRPDVAPSLEQQIDAYFERIDGEARLSPETLFVVYIGGNDVLLRSRLGAGPGEDDIAHAVDGIAAAIRRLAERGAKCFLVPNQGDVGNTPKMRRLWSCECRGRAATRLSLFFNCRLAPALDTLEADLGIRIARVDALSLGRRLRAEAPEHGWTNVTDACLFTLCSCRFDEYFFFDSLHPTASRHQVNGQVLIQATTDLAPGS